MFGSSLPSALGWLVATKVYSGTGADIVMESITLKIPQLDTSLCPIGGVLPALSARWSSNHTSLPNPHIAQPARHLLPHRAHIPHFRRQSGLRSTGNAVVYLTNVRLLNGRKDRAAMNRHGDVSALTATPQGGAAPALAQALRYRLR